MLPRSKSRFCVAEEAGGDRAAPGAKRPRPENLVGLQILVQLHQQHHHHRHRRDGHGASIVFKPMFTAAARTPARRVIHGGPGFLTACLLCKTELSPNKDVYMYRGDQGFCSQECRWQQILLDEANEVEAIKNQRRGLSHHHSPRSPIRGGPRRILAVA